MKGVGKWVILKFNCNFDKSVTEDDDLTQVGNRIFFWPNSGQFFKGAQFYGKENCLCVPTSFRLNKEEEEEKTICIKLW